ncbi:hypothetical protein F01_530039 [Burkholderia cenocepacia]|nr:hypothetical protein F01_530039 [Burkholderia cenocepacia]
MPSSARSRPGTRFASAVFARPSCDSIRSPLPYAFRFCFPRARQVARQTPHAPTRPRAQRRPDPPQALVRRSHAKKRCTRYRARHLQIRRSGRDRRVAEALGRTQPPPQGIAVPVGDVDAELLREPRGPQPAENTPRDARTREAEAARGIRPQALTAGAPPLFPCCDHTHA